ncbi:hypothetical protein LINGRAHAP2_LOCUS22661 [Linum grandiflorum]
MVIETPDFFTPQQSKESKKILYPDSQSQMMDG